MLSPESNSTRMIRLLPDENKDAPIKCKLFNYALSRKGSGKHLYEALSYIWGSDVKSESIIVNGCAFSVTKNLHAVAVVPSRLST